MLNDHQAKPNAVGLFDDAEVEIWLPVRNDKVTTLLTLANGDRNAPYPKLLCKLSHRHDFTVLHLRSTLSSKVPDPPQSDSVSEFSGSPNPSYTCAE